MVMGKKFAAIVMLDLALCYAMALWVIFGNTTAETVFKAYFWAVMPLSILGYILAPQSVRGFARSPWWFIGYARGVRIVAAALLAVAHEVAMLAMLIVAWLSFEAAMRYCIDKEAES
ncbi:hypothetical protein [Pelomicrobium methylotrophicum]|uniref:Uncharacterized protein n=1 Tax=Pelomicrobium methylotrophicum TaxID=2602750 RepID=A0A5C7EV10_9PROT|nr:hypothetical protein [Pelomicrobium methylotrophicum]TXF11917.1 hypothetical protein FR698_07900 [Pelomicrobium methylotrophicum]